jgi:hypothetical protein
MCRARIYPKEQQWSPSYQSCIEACNTCADACDYCSIACLQEDDVKMMAECIRLDLDCAAICRLAAALTDSERRRSQCALVNHEKKQPNQENLFSQWVAAIIMNCYTTARIVTHVCRHYRREQS